MIKPLLRSVREYKKPSLLAPVFVALEVVMEVLIPMMMASLIDYGINKGNMSYILRTGSILLIASMLSLFFGTVSGKQAAKASAGFAKNLRGDMYENIQTFSFSNIDRYSTSSLITRMTTDVTNVQNAYQMIIRVAVRSPLMLVFSLFACFRIDNKLSFIFLISAPILGLGLYLIMIKAFPLFQRVFKTYDRLNQVVQEDLSGIRVVKAFTREEREIHKFNDVSQSIYGDFRRAEKILAFNMPLMQGCVYLCLLLLSWFGAKAVVASHGDPVLGLSTGELMSLMTYTMQILMSLMMLSMVFVMITMAKASLERISEVLQEKSNLTSPADALTTVKDGSIEFQNVTFSYHKNADKPVLNQVNITIPSGATVGILGGTGSSKSSLVQLIPRLYDVAEGSVKVGGEDVRAYDLDSLRNQVSMVLQKNVLFSGTIKENLRWGDENATDQEIRHACQLACAEEFISQMPEGYDTYIEQGGTNVSGGQKQRLCIARALLKKPKILILDDSTSAVDTRTDARIREAFAKEIPDTTKIIIAQRVSSVQDADLILVMEDGQVNAAGTHEELMESSQIYREVYESQQKGGGEDEAE